MLNSEHWYMLIQATMGSYAFVFVFLVMVFLLSLENHEIEGRQDISTEEDIEFEERLKILNKPPVKTIHSAWGDTYDCIDFYKQPAFDHPLLKNHKTQMMPDLGLERVMGEASIFRARVERCPQGTVPIRRTRKEDLIRAKNLSPSIESISNGGNGDQYFAGIVYQHDGETFYGAAANISIWKPNTNPNQYSLAEICLRSGEHSYSRIHVGWTVNPILYDNDTTVRNFIYWTADNGKQSGCWNTLCLGFVQVNPLITPDEPIKTTSTFEGNVIEMHSHIYLNTSEKRVWYAIQGVKIGYWPVQIFPLFADIGVERIYWGGHSMGDDDGHAPEMGSGHFPNEQYNHAAYFTQMQYNDASGALLDINEKMQTDVIECKKNYDMDYYGFIEEGGRRHTLQYGGPGGGC